MCTSAAYYSAETVEASAALLRWQMAFGLVFNPAFFWLIALYTGQKRIKLWLGLVTAFCALYSIINFLSPYSVRFQSLKGVEQLHLAWGETLYRLQGTPRLPLLHLSSLAILLWAVWRTVVLLRGSRRRTAVFLGAYCLLQFLVQSEGLLIDRGVINSFYTAGFAGLGLILLMTASMAFEDRDRTAAQIKDIDISPQGPGGLGRPALTLSV